MLFHSLMHLLCGLTVASGFLTASNLKYHPWSNSELHLKSDEYRKRKQDIISIKDFINKFEKTAISQPESVSKSSKKKSSRTRKKKDNPQQTYVYAAQKKKYNQVIIKEESEEGDVQIQVNLDQNNPITIARNLGMNPTSQVCDAAYHVRRNEETSILQTVPAEEPRIVGELRLGLDENDSASAMYAYVIEKPVGWSILEGSKKKKSKQKQDEQDPETPLESKKAPVKELKKKSHQDSKKIAKVKYYDYETKSFDTIEYDQSSILSAMTPEEIEEFERDGGFNNLNLSEAGARAAMAAANAIYEYDDDDEIDAIVANANVEDDNNDSDSDTDSNASHDVYADFEDESRPSVVTWLKSLKAKEGTPIRGGKFWTALSGAVETDDSGLVLLCPKDKVENVHVESANYVAVVGNGKFFAPKGKKTYIKGVTYATNDEAKIDVIAKLRKGRLDDVVLTTQVSIPEGVSTSNDVVQICQKEFLDGIRGDYSANPLDRRSSRRLVHCSSLEVSSLTHDDTLDAKVNVPEDIRIVSDRRNHHEFMQGSFLGRNHLKNSGHTTAYREINGAADGFPGWTVDRYDKWLLVQHDEMYEKGPLPSLHDGNTFGVYYFPTDRDRSITGPKKGIKPSLLEGRPAPDAGIEVTENGIKYIANFDDLSTGIFLDQRHQRAWLSRHCTPNTRVLNCFAHCGAFSIAAATAGAVTVSLDLDKKWLDRIKPQLELNGIEDMEKHDTIYGDCFDWLQRLEKRSEKFDMVILDPPSTSVGKAKKRWSAKNDYDELVALAAPLVKKGGLLWTTTNSNQIHPIKFARMCKKGLVNAGFPDARLEKVATMPSDFPLIGPQNVKNLCWRFP